ncbi:MAG: helix-turn-helix transcriptional regulator, partial [Oscillospiraceae bacterium]
EIDVRDNLKAIISERGYIQATIAKKANLTPAKLSAILNKTRKLDVNEMVVICGVLQIKPEELINYQQAS